MHITKMSVQLLGKKKKQYNLAYEIPVSGSGGCLF